MGKRIEELDGEELRKSVQELDDKIKRCIRKSRRYFEKALAHDQKKERAEMRLEELGLVERKERKIWGSNDE
jgi:hypothetical protein